MRVLLCISEQTKQCFELCKTGGVFDLAAGPMLMDMYMDICVVCVCCVVLCCVCVVLCCVVLCMSMYNI